MAVKKGVILAGVIGTAGAPVAGYFIYDRLKDGDAPPATAATKPAILEPKTEGRSFYGTSGNFKAGDCAKTFFSNVTFQFLTGGASTDDFDLGWGESGDLEACLILHAKLKNGDTGPLAASTELAVKQGNKGLVMWTVIPGDPSNGDSLREEVKLVLLDKSGETWTAKKGYSWHTKAGAGKNSLRGIKIKVTGTDERTLDNSAGKLWELNNKSATTTGKESEYKGRWSFSSATTGGADSLLGKIEITDKNDKASALWGTKDHKLTKGSFLYGSMGTDWKWTSNFSKSLSKDVDIPFKDIKGKWKAET